jgi:hypothetical protein
MTEPTDDLARRHITSLLRYAHHLSWCGYHPDSYIECICGLNKQNDEVHAYLAVRDQLMKGEG